MQGAVKGFWEQHAYVAQLWTFIISVVGAFILVWRFITKPIWNKISLMDEKDKELEETIEEAISNRENGDDELGEELLKLRDRMQTEMGKIGAIEELFKFNRELDRRIQKVEIDVAGRLGGIESTLKIMSEQLRK